MKGGDYMANLSQIAKSRLFDFDSFSRTELRSDTFRHR